MSYRLPHERSGTITIEEMWSSSSRLQRFVLVGACANFFFFLLGYILIGGDALQGEQSDGRYWVGNKGNLREVSKAAYHYSVLHLMSLLFSHPLALAMVITARRRSRSAREGSVHD